MFSSLAQHALFAFLHRECVALTESWPRKVLKAKSQQGQQLLQQGGWGWTLYTAGHVASGLRRGASWPGSETELEPKLGLLTHNKTGNTCWVVYWGGVYWILLSTQRAWWLFAVITTKSEQVRQSQAVTGLRLRLRTLGDEWDFERPPAQREPCPAAAETDIHANHNRNDRPSPPTTSHPDSHFSQPVSLPVQQTTSYPTRGSTPVPAQTDWDKLGQSPPPLPPTLPLHCALQQPLLRGLIPRSNHHLYLLCWHN